MGVQDLLQSGIGWLSGQLQQNAAEAVVYARGAASVAVYATFGTSLLKLTDDMGGSRVERTDADFLIPASVLVLSGAKATPQRGDTVTVTLAGVMYVYEVLPYDDEPPWRWSDPYHTIYRIHTKRVS